MTGNAGPADRYDRDRQAYEIRLQGRLSPRWSGALDGLQMTANDDGTTTLAGDLADQAALHGLLQRIRDLGMPIISICRVDPVDGGCEKEALS